MDPTSRIFGLTDNIALYEVLGLTKCAGAADIKKAYRRLAVRYHPDKNPDGVERFQEISFAYKVLSDPEQRELYDSSRLKSSDAKPSRAMDPEIDLEGEELREFVNSLAREQGESSRRRESFESRKRDEAQRRLRFDRENPTFKMPSLPSLPNTTQNASHRSPVEELEALSRSHHSTTHFSKFSKNADHQEHQNMMYERVMRKPAEETPASEVKGERSGVPYSIYGRRRVSFSPPPHAQCRPPQTSQTQATKTSPPQHSRRSRHCYTSAPTSFLANGGRPEGGVPYSCVDINKLHQRTSGFNYKTYVQDKMHADLLHDAILSDALEGMRC